MIFNKTFCNNVQISSETLRLTMGARQVWNQRNPHIGNFSIIMTSNARTILSVYDDIKISQVLQVYIYGGHHLLRFYQVHHKT